MKLKTGNYAGQISWNLGSCQSKRQGYGSYARYVEQCCLPTGSYTLQCKDSASNGWHGGYIEVDGQKYCDNFLGGNVETSQITVEGNGKYFSYFASILFSICSRLVIFLHLNSISRVRPSSLHGT